MTSQEVFPPDYPATYREVIRHVTDITSDTNIQQPWIQFDYMDMKVEREGHALRAIFQEMMDLQTLSSYTIRTRDLASPYTTSLAAYASYYHVSGAEAPDGVLLGPIEVHREEVVKTPVFRPRVPVVPVPQEPVPALW
ncbi:hypothetical protein [Thalassoporum mexicanum]|uniref:hypothetical protein n=1 Tax=Thalassoporum mexicanum TaxID=3457544 RepID=UPI0012E9DBF2|nr:hypothetical protein [Pseudanabaena sp. PCC 7367]